MTAEAQSPVDLGGAYVVDTVNAVGSRGAEITAATDALYASTKLQLFVVYVDRFTGVSDKTAWAESVAKKNGLGGNDILLAVATVDRNYSIFYGDSAPNAASTQTVETDDIIPALKKSDWVGAAVAAANGYAGVSSGNTGGGSDTNTPGTPATPGGGPALPIVIVLMLLALVVLGVIFFLRSRRKRTAGGGVSAPAGPSQAQLDQRAGSLLVRLDDSLKTSEQELGFAIAQFGTEATTPFSASLATAKSQVAEAFTLRQKLDDSVPETPEQKRVMTSRIIDLCEAADTELDAQADAFDDLRRLEQNAPQALLTVVTDAETVTARLATARATLTTLQESFSPAALSSITGNPDQVTKLLEFVGSSGSAAQAAIASGDSAAAAINVRAAQASIGQTTQLLDSIDTLAAGLADARSTLAAAVADTQQDLATARAALPAAASDFLSEPTAAAQAGLTAATTGTGPADPLASLASLSTANAALDRVLDAVRDEQQKLQSATAQLPTAMSTAFSQISAANDFITTRRGGVGADARTRASEAARHLELATGLAPSDPVRALAEATAAQSLAAQALALAQNDVDYGGGMGLGGGGGGGQGGSLGGGLGAAILGGLIGGMLGGGGGIFGGSGMGSDYGGGGFGGSSRSSGGSFSGGSSSGGRF